MRAAGIAASILLAAASSPPAPSCTLSEPTLWDQVADARVVAVAEVDAYDPGGRAADDDFFAPRVLRLRIGGTWKGAVEPTVHATSVGYFARREDIGEPGHRLIVFLGERLSDGTRLLRSFSHGPLDADVEGAYRDAVHATAALIEQGRDTLADRVAWAVDAATRAPTRAAALRVLARERDVAAFKLIQAREAAGGGEEDETFDAEADAEPTDEDGDLYLASDDEENAEWTEATAGLLTASQRRALARALVKDDVAGPDLTTALPFLDAVGDAALDRLALSAVAARLRPGADAADLGTLAVATLRRFGVREPARRLAGERIGARGGYTSREKLAARWRELTWELALPDAPPVEAKPETPTRIW